MEQWPSDKGAGLPNQRHQVQNYKITEKLSAFHCSKVNLMNIKDPRGLGG